MKAKRLLFSLLLAALAACSPRPVTDWVDPRIGSEGLGRTFIGPSCPFGMVKPSPDCTTAPNSGWLPMPERVDGFAQVHVSGTGGGPKYGNILLMPQERFSTRRQWDLRASEEILPAYYATVLERSGIGVEITAAERATVYRFRYPEGGDRALVVDLGFFLGEQSVPGAREAQEFVDSGAEFLDSCTLGGFQTIRGGWNNGGPYTVYFRLQADRPFVRTELERGKDGKTVAAMDFGAQAREVTVRVGISFLDGGRAGENLARVADRSFAQVRADCLAQWERLLDRVELGRRTPARLRRMFYTALYHTMLMPVDRTGEWAPAGGEVYYDDYYALWDTYRTSLPLITLLDPARERDIVNALLTIYRHDGYLPDARSGNANGRTQGGSNAEIVLADAFVKGLEGIDYGQALEAMLKDAEVPPADDEAEGRGGLEAYNTLGYIPWGIPRAGNRTLEYAQCDEAIATVARGLGREDLYEKYHARAGNWRHLWRADCEDGGVRGFILPRAADGTWLDTLSFGHSRLRSGRYAYTPTTFEGPWYSPWWSDFFYEADSWEYSLSVPHDVPGLIEACGGPQAFGRRLERFFADDHYHVENEPSFLASCLYHWTGRPDRSSERTRQIVERYFGDGPRGLPGNDDSGATSAWLAFHLMGLYPLAGTPDYVVHVPLLPRTVLHLEGGRRLVIRAPGLRAGRSRLLGVRLNGKELSLDSLFLSHAQLLSGGRLTFRTGRGGTDLAPLPAPRRTPEPPAAVDPVAVADSVLQTCRLHGQTRRFAWYFTRQGDSLRLHWRIQRNLRMWRGSYTLLPDALENARMLSFRMPEDGLHVTLGADEVFGILPRARLRELKRLGITDFNATRWQLVDSLGTALTRTLLHARDIHEGAEIWVLDYEPLPLIWQLQDNPMEIDWRCSSLEPQQLELLADADRCGSVFYAYPGPSGTQTPPPAGYAPFYLSHYGRHGSRYQGSDARYKDVLDLLEGEGRRRNLTPFGQEVLGRMRLLWSEVRGHGGALSPLGEQQHREIARRMAENYPSLFVPGASVDARSSTVQRCQDSMDAFCGSLLAEQPGLSVTRAADAQTMAVLVPKNPDIDALDADRAPWRLTAFRRFQEANLHPGRLFASLFLRPAQVAADPIDTMEAFFYLVVGQQDICSEVDLSDLLTDEELFALWRCMSSRMYYVNTRCPGGGMTGPLSARPLLADFVERACAAVDGSRPDAVTLRFGHDSILIRLLSLIGVAECASEEADPQRWWRAWRDWEVSPMAANFQLVFYRDRRGSVLVKCLLNEKETAIPALGDGPYYPWPQLRAYLESLL